MARFVVQKHNRCTLERVEKFISDVYFTDVNLRGRLYPWKAPVTSLKHHCCGKRISYNDAVARKFSDTQVGHAFGKTWTTHWFEVKCNIPEDWAGREVHFKWDSDSEAMVWIDGQPVQGLTGGGCQSRHDFIITKCAVGNESITLYVEMAANAIFGAGHNGLINPPDRNRMFVLREACIAVFDRDCYDLLVDLSILHDLAKHLSDDSSRAYEALLTANDIINQCDPFDRDTFARCHEIALAFFSQGGGPHRFSVSAIANCHIDCAWLWPYDETIRKCARSWSSTIRLMDDYPDLFFVASQAQQFEWVKDNYPGLYSRIKEKVVEGRFIPVGGTWVEMDGNLPSGESFIRQFLVGQRFFKAEFGSYCDEFWLPDTFGYSAQLPQIMKSAGIQHFLTQKLSWNLTNKFPHSTFFWEGIDGSRCLVHFPPADTYGSDASVHDVLKSETNMKDKGRSSQSLLLYGYGDGGGGPTEDMLERLMRLRDLEGLPKLVFESPHKFFSGFKERGEFSRLVSWVGELYFELHRGTYTTQALVKQCNRRCEVLLHDVEFVAAMAMFNGEESHIYPRSELLRLWKLLLLNQFHDVLPGSSINEVYVDAMQHFKDIQTVGQGLWDSAVLALGKSSMEKSDVVVNTLCWDRQEVIDVTAISKDSPSPIDHFVQTTEDGSSLAYVSCPAMGYCSSSTSLFSGPPAVAASVVESKTEGTFVLSNGLLKASIDGNGCITSCVLLANGRDAIASEQCGNQFVLFDDIPLFWDAWDVMEYHLETRKPVAGGVVTVKDVGPLRASVQVKMPVGQRSSLVQTIHLDVGSAALTFTTEVDWHENHKFLKVEFPLNVRSSVATYEIQFGHLDRPTHYNTSWDHARFEVCGHKWADLSEHGFGVALLNDCKYGYSTLANVMRLSLLRSPKAPDEKADMGKHTFKYALLPHEGEFQTAGVIKRAYELNYPLRLHCSCGDGDVRKSFFQVSNPGVIIECVKAAEDREDCLLVRLYESFGGWRKTHLSTSLSVSEAHRCNILEEPLEKVLVDENGLRLQFRPFEIVSLLLQVA